MKDDKDLPNLIVYITSFIVIHLLHSITSIHLHMLAAAFFFLVYKRFGDTIKITRNYFFFLPFFLITASQLVAPFLKI